MSLLFGSGTLVDKRAIPRKGRGRATIAGPLSVSRGCARLATPAREFVPQGLPQSEHDCVASAGRTHISEAGT